MTFIVEAGAGTPGANAYDTAAAVLAYLTDQGRETENSWSTLSTAVQQQNIVKATLYIDSRFRARLKGVKLNASIEGRQATGTITFASNPLDTEEVVVAQKTYRFVAALVQENDVLIGATKEDSANSLHLAIAGDSGDASVQEDTLANEVVGSSVEDAVVSVAAAEGENGNTVVLTTTVTGATLDPTGGTLDGGLDEAPQPLQFPRSGLRDRDGRLVLGVPLNLRHATAEYAVRAASSVLAPDPVVDATGLTPTLVRNRLDKLETERQYAAGSVSASFTPYPAADALLADYLLSVGVFR